MGKISRYFSTPDDEEEENSEKSLPTKSRPRPPPSAGDPTLTPAVELVTASRTIKKYKKVKGSKYAGSTQNKGKVQIPHRKKQKSVGTKEDEEFPGPAPLPPGSQERHGRGKGLSSSSLDVKMGVRKTKIMQKEEKIKSGLDRAARSEILLVEDSGGIEVDEGEHTLQLKQFDITKKVDIASATKGFHLSLEEFGPYSLRYTTNGRYLVMGGRKGHIAAFDWVTKNLMCEMGVRESVHDVVWLHNENMFAAAQKEWTYIYDNQGIEIHCMKSMDRVINLDFLPYHFLLVGGHQSGFLSWVDVSIGKIVAQFNARHGPIGLMTTNPANAVVHCGHTNGTVSLWAPTVRKPLASILCHGCPLSAVAVDAVGRLMATSGRDGSMRIWDLRNSFTPLTSVKVGVASSLNFSQRGFLAMATANDALIFSEVGHRQKPYLKHVANSQISSMQFCPFEDVLGVGTSRGFDSVIIPGAGEPNFDALERNPYQSKSQRREAEVKALLEKIQPELITLDNNVLGEVDTDAVSSSLDKKPKYVKKADIHLAHRKKRKNAKLPKIKEGLRSELNLKMAKQDEQSKKQEDKSKKVVQLSSNDPLSRFVKKAK